MNLREKFSCIFCAIMAMLWLVDGSMDTSAIYIVGALIIASRKD